MSADNLTGSFYVRRLGAANDDADRLFRRTRDWAALRRQALKLRYWPSPRTTESSGQVVDLDWSMIRALPDLKIGELRVHETIGGHDNLRIIFFVGPSSDRYPKTCIWVLAVMQKKRDDFTAAQIANFKGRRRIVLTRYYESTDIEH
jgi:hypothetical protein